MITWNFVIRSSSTWFNWQGLDGKRINKKLEGKGHPHLLVFIYLPETCHLMVCPKFSCKSSYCTAKHHGPSSPATIDKFSLKFFSKGCGENDTVFLFFADILVKSVGNICFVITDQNFVISWCQKWPWSREIVITWFHGASTSFKWSLNPTHFWSDCFRYVAGMT